MMIKQLIIKNFRNLKNADLKFGKNTLLVGSNNVGKSTVLEALDLLLGPDRLNSLDAVNEHDFYGSRYLDKDDQPIPIEIETRLYGLNDRQKRLFKDHLEYWDTQDNKFVEMQEGLDEERFHLDCLRVAFKAYYDREEDEFKTETYFLNPELPNSESTNKFIALTRNDKREIGYLFLRVLRTGSRALSLERGSLLNIILDLKEIKTSSWETILSKLKGAGNELDKDTGFRDVLSKIEDKVKKYTPLRSGEDKSSQFEITNLTRKNLRSSLNIFVGTEPSNELVPFRSLGTGTINVLLLALMSFIADLKRENEKNVIFSMEEPEIALPPYTQRRVIDELFEMSDQALVTSHSPYVTERFINNNILVLKNDGEKISGHNVDFGPFKEKIFRRDFRTRFAEGLLSKGIIAVEGVSDELTLYATSQKLPEFCSNYIHLDIIGMVVIDNEGGGNINNIGQFFKSLNIKTYAFYDKGQQVSKDAFDSIKEHDHKSLEKLLVEEIPENVLKEFFDDCKKYPDYPQGTTLKNNTKDDVCAILEQRKREGYSAKLLSFCKKEADLPQTIVDFLKNINNDLTQSKTK